MPENKGAEALRRFASAIEAAWMALVHYGLVFDEWTLAVERAAGVSFDTDTRSYFDRSGNALEEMPDLNARAQREDEECCAIVDRAYISVRDSLTTAQALARDLAGHLSAGFASPSEHQTSISLALKQLSVEFPHGQPLRAHWQGGPGRLRRENEELRRFFEVADVSNRLREVRDWALCAADAVPAGPVSTKDSSALTAEPRTKRQLRLDKLAQAMFLVMEQPELADAEIARRVGVNKSTLSRSEPFKAGAAKARLDRSAIHEGLHLRPRDGSRSLVDGVIENVEDAEPEEEEREETEEEDE